MVHTFNPKRSKSISIPRPTKATQWNPPKWQSHSTEFIKGQVFLRISNCEWLSSTASTTNRSFCKLHTSHAFIKESKVRSLGPIPGLGTCESLMYPKRHRSQARCNSSKESHSRDVLYWKSPYLAWTGSEFDPQLSKNRIEKQTKNREHPFHIEAVECTTQLLDFLQELERWLVCGWLEFRNHSVQQACT